MAKKPKKELDPLECTICGNRRAEKCTSPDGRHSEVPDPKKGKRAGKNPSPGDSVEVGDQEAPAPKKKSPRKKKAGAEQSPDPTTTKTSETPSTPPSETPNGGSEKPSDGVDYSLTWGEPQEGQDGIADYVRWESKDGAYRIERRLNHHVVPTSDLLRGPERLNWWYFGVLHKKFLKQRNEMVWSPLIWKEDGSGDVRPFATLEAALEKVLEHHRAQTGEKDPPNNNVETLASAEKTGWATLPIVSKPESEEAMKTKSTTKASKSTKASKGNPNKETSANKDAFGTRVGSNNWKLNEVLSKKPMTVKELREKAGLTSGGYVHLSLLAEKKLIGKKDDTFFLKS